MAEAIQNFIDGLTPWIVIGAGLILFWKVPVWKTRIEDQVENIGNRLDKVEARLDDLYKLLTHSIDRPVVQSSSPLTLTEYGNTISDRVNADQIAKHYAQQLLESVEGLNPYQIQEHCFNYCENQLMDALKDDFHQRYEDIHSVAFKDGIEISKITRVIAIKLRDAIFSTKGTSPEDLDRHSPD